MACPSTRPTPLPGEGKQHTKLPQTQNKLHTYDKTKNRGRTNTKKNGARVTKTPRKRLVEESYYNSDQGPPSDVGKEYSGKPEPKNYTNTNAHSNTGKSLAHRRAPVSSPPAQPAS